MNVRIIHTYQGPYLVGSHESSRSGIIVDMRHNCLTRSPSSESESLRVVELGSRYHTCANPTVPQLTSTTLPSSSLLRDHSVNKHQTALGASFFHQAFRGAAHAAWYRSGHLDRLKCLVSSAGRQKICYATHEVDKPTYKIVV